MFQQIDQHRTADAVVGQIELLILKGLLHSGDRLPSERDLAEQLGVSRPVLRDALKTLEDRNLIEARRGGGTYVCDLIGPIFSDAVVDLISRHSCAISDHFDFRRGIEAQAASLAAIRAAPSDISRLTGILEQMREAHAREDIAAEAALDLQFHHAVGEAAHNIILLHTLRSCYRILENGVYFDRERLYRVPAARADVLDQHAAIAAAISEGDPVAARQASEQHIDYVRAALLEAEEEDKREALAGLRRLLPSVAKSR
ncbi:FCD domain-containing protein [Roseibium denhamense]|uniref:Pyruvate dehydrogenase complex repressor n=1 Tax=Roseibium denhamense TaxID=76305 RepID=A0ABY1P1X0_9HYPH|nr:FCD domain-containing protein [Roseibium denhamense]MTI07638.1 FCD domain-containing protein [Roseibium denhamense]SMP24248.1 transcriptional regulator, GntR family [Roseibium denhamense]